MIALSSSAATAQAIPCRKAAGQKVAMWYYLSKLLLLSSMCLGVCVVVGMTGRVWAQDHHRSVTYVYVPLATAATPLSTVIDAQARYIAAHGDCMESLAIARKINAEAYQLELRNWVEEVDSYFKRRELNRLWRRKENPNYSEREAIRQRELDKEVREQFQRFSESDLSGRLNWLLMKLSSPAIGIQYFGETESQSVPALMRPVSDEEKRRIWITDGGKGGSQLVCRLSDGEVLKTPWPPALRRQECAAARAEYDAASKKVQTEIQANQSVSYESKADCVKAVNTLFATLEDVYPPEQRRDINLFLEYSNAKVFLRSLMAQIGRTVSTTDPSVFDGSLRFQGKTLGELIQHMTRRGVLFAPPHPGEEGTYKSLLTDLANTYVKLSPAPQASQDQQARSPEQPPAN